MICTETVFTSCLWFVAVFLPWMRKWSWEECTQGMGVDIEDLWNRASAGRSIVSRYTNYIGLWYLNIPKGERLVTRTNRLLCLGVEETSHCDKSNEALLRETGFLPTSMVSLDVCYAHRWFIPTRDILQQHPLYAPTAKDTQNVKNILYALYNIVPVTHDTSLIFPSIPKSRLITFWHSWNFIHSWIRKKNKKSMRILFHLDPWHVGNKVWNAWAVN